MMSEGYGCGRHPLSFGAVRPRVLVLAPELPFPASDGLRVRVAQAVSSVLGFADVDLLVFGDGGDEGISAGWEATETEGGGALTVSMSKRPSIPLVWRLIRSLIALRPASQIRYSQRAYRRLLAEHLRRNRYDYGLVLGGDALLSHARRLRGQRVGIDLCDDVEAAYRTAASIAPTLLRRFHLALQAHLFRISARRDLKNADDAIFISMKDAAAGTFVPNLRTRVVLQLCGPGVLRFRPQYDTGGTDAAVRGRNALATQPRCGQVFRRSDTTCRSARQYHGAVFRVVGKGASELAGLPSDPGIELMDYVPNLPAQYARGHSLCVPASGRIWREEQGPPGHGGSPPGSDDQHSEQKERTALTGRTY